MRNELKVIFSNTSLILSYLSLYFLFFKNYYNRFSLKPEYIFISIPLVWSIVSCFIYIIGWERDSLWDINVVYCADLAYSLNLNPNLIISGDFNIIPEEIDVYDYKRYENDALYRLEIRKKYRELINLGFSDVYRHFNKSKQEYTFWDYFSGSWQKNYGMRIDHFLISNNLLDNAKSININKKPRSKTKPSDHTPIELEIN